MKVKPSDRQFCLPTMICLAMSLILHGCINTPEVQAGAFLGNMKADRILFIGNSVTLHGPYNVWNEDAHWGMAASEESKDYVHLLTSKIDAATGGSLELPNPTVVPPRWFYGDPLPNYAGNIINIADVFERNYDTWDNARLQNQIDAQPDIVVLQFGENLADGTLRQISQALNELLDGLKNSSNPNIFITSSILEPNLTLDAFKRQACAADPDHLVFVDLNGIVDNSGVAGHPSDAGMQTIADTLFDAMTTHSVPEPGVLTVLLSGCGLLSLMIRRRH